MELQNLKIDLTIKRDIQLYGHIFKNNILYSKSNKTPILRVSHEKIYISFSDSYRESIFEIIKYLQNNNLDKKDIIFVREDNLFMWKLDRYSYHYENLSNTLENWTNPLFYYGFEKIGFDFQLSISNYIKYYDCMNVFTDVYDRVGSLLLGKKWINSDQFYKKTDIISDETIKNSLYSLLIDLKIKKIFNE